MQCSAGFYALVAKPSFNCYTKNNTTYVGSVRITCIDVIVDHDDTGSEYCMVVKLNLHPVLSGNGNVNVHLFHSQQKLQM